MSISWQKFIQCFCGIEFNFRVGLLSKNGGILLSGGRMQNVGSLRIPTSKVDGLSSWWQGLCPWGLLLPELFLLFLSVSLEVVNSSSEVVCPLLQEKKGPGSRIVQRCISWWQLYAVVWGCSVLYVISTLFLSIKPQGWTGEGKLQK